MAQTPFTVCYGQMNEKLEIIRRLAPYTISIMKKVYDAEMTYPELEAERDLYREVLKISSMIDRLLGEVEALASMQLPQLQTSSSEDNDFKTKIETIYARAVHHRPQLKTAKALVKELEEEIFIPKVAVHQNIVLHSRIGEIHDICDKCRIDFARPLAHWTSC